MQEKKNIHPDRAVLPEDSLLYQKEDKRSTREKLKSMTLAQKLEYIWEYYGLNLAIGLGLTGIVIFLVVNALCAKEIALQIVAVNASSDGAPAEEPDFYGQALAACGLDLEKVTVSVNSSLAVSATGEDEVSRTNIQMIQSRFMTNSVDVFFAEEDFFYSLAEFEYLGDLRNYLSEELIEEYADDIVYVTGVESKETLAAGIRLTDNSWVERSGWYDGPVVVGIADGAKHADTAEELLREILTRAP